MRPRARDIRAMVEEIPDAKPGRGQRRFRAPFWVYEDRARNLALIRGNPRTVREVLELAVLTEEARWSSSGKGWVLSLDHLPNLAAMADYAGAPYRCKQVGVE